MTVTQTFVAAVEYSVRVCSSQHRLRAPEPLPRNGAKIQRMKQASETLLDDVLREAARITWDERRARIARCVAEGSHDPDKLPSCIEPSNQESVRYCERCWSVIDPHGRTWNWPPQELESLSVRPRAEG
jgi:hypothetical protein